MARVCPGYSGSISCDPKTREQPFPAAGTAPKHRARLERHGSSNPKQCAPAPDIRGRDLTRLPPHRASKNGQKKLTSGKDNTAAAVTEKDNSLKLQPSPAIPKRAHRLCPRHPLGPPSILETQSPPNITTPLPSTSASSSSPRQIRASPAPRPPGCIHPERTDLRPASLPRLSRHNPIDPRIRPLEVLHKRSHTSIRVTEPAFIPLRSPAGDGNRCRSAKIGPGRAESPLRSCRQSPLGPVQGRFTVRVTRDGDSGSEGKARLSPASSTLTLAKRVSPDGCLIHARAHSACPVA